MSELWKQLHLRAIDHTDSHDILFLAHFVRSIPRYTHGCACQEHFTVWKRSHPPQFGHHLEYFKWTVEAHNAVNIKLGKPIMSFEEAYQLYKN